MPYPPPNPPCPTPEKAPGHEHVVRAIGSFGLEIGIGYECTTCWTKFMYTPGKKTPWGGQLVMGHPEPAPYPAWDFDEEG